MKDKKIIFLSITFIVLLSGSAITIARLLFNHPFQTEDARFIYIDTDDTVDSVYIKLEKELHVKRLTGFRLLASLYKYNENIHTGAYQFSCKETTWHAFQKLKAGHQTPVRLVVPATRTLERMVRTVSRQIMADSASIARLLADSIFCAKMGYTSETLPSLFLPNTYEVYWNMKAEEFIKRMKKEHDRFWNKKRLAQADSIGLTPNEVSTLASIVEEETANQKEKPMVAGLYMNRLRIGMPLQADPTIKFSLKEFGLKRILFKHLAVDSPYNTYKHIGLPPGPIRIPSINGLESVLNYTRHNYLYMCAKEDFSGTHNFASTLTAHRANAQRYQQALNRRKIR